MANVGVTTAESNTMSGLAMAITAACTAVSVTAIANCEIEIVYGTGTYVAFIFYDVT